MSDEKPMGQVIQIATPCWMPRRTSYVELAVTMKPGYVTTLVRWFAGLLKRRTQ